MNREAFSQPEEDSAKPALTQQGFPHSGREAKNPDFGHEAVPG
jgi:hypothetical protein